MPENRDSNKYIWGGKPGTGKARNPRIMVSMHPDVQGLLKQIALLSGESMSSIIVTWVRDTAGLMGLSVADNEEKYKP